MVVLRTTQCSIRLVENVVWWWLYVNLDIFSVLLVTTVTFSFFWRSLCFNNYAVGKRGNFCLLVFVFCSFVLGAWFLCAFSAWNLRCLDRHSSCRPCIVDCPEPGMFNGDDNLSVCYWHMANFEMTVCPECLNSFPPSCLCRGRKPQEMWIALYSSILCSWSYSLRSCHVGFWISKHG